MPVFVRLLVLGLVLECPLLLPMLIDRQVFFEVLLIILISINLILMYSFFITSNNTAVSFSKVVVLSLGSSLAILCLLYKDIFWLLLFIISDCLLPFSMFPFGISFLISVDYPLSFK